MLTILKAYVIPDELVMAIIIMYEDNTAKVITPDGETVTFKSLTTVLQRDAYMYKGIPFRHRYRLSYENRFNRK